ncbi:MAG TPA: hypothetical protein VGQ57_17610, partial [Polyangiaceae bacterium]|nr:hypothetical protein [Polyangiaceae bacterium]
MSRFRARSTPPRRAFLVLALVPVWLGCEREHPAEKAVASASPAELAVDRAAIATYAAIAHAAYSDAASGVRSL